MFHRMFGRRKSPVNEEEAADAEEATEEKPDDICNDGFVVLGEFVTDDMSGVLAICKMLFENLLLVSHEEVTRTDVFPVPCFHTFCFISVLPPNFLPSFVSPFASSNQIDLNYPYYTYMSSPAMGTLPLCTHSSNCWGSV